LKDALKPDLARLNQSLEELAQNTDGFLGDLLSYVLRGSGKRVRPALVMLGSRLGPSDDKSVQVVAQAVELVHIATLIHDDVIDNAVLRRGRKTVAAENGVDAAVLLGDHVYTYAFQRVAALGHPQLVELLAGATAIMCAGEIEQLKKRFQFNLSEADYFRFIYEKTASLFGTSARSGAVLAGQSQKIQFALEKFGVSLGIAFQITDDLLDITGEEAVVGKTLRTDLMNGKMTLPLIHYRDQLPNSAAKEEFASNLRNPDGRIEQIVERMVAAGSIRYSEDVAKRRVEEALSELDALPKGHAREHFTALAEMLLARQN
jgi:geranylgeranyl pyrophosphate synthase